MNNLNQILGGFCPLLNTFLQLTPVVGGDGDEYLLFVMKREGLYSDLSGFASDPEHLRSCLIQFISHLAVLADVGVLRKNLQNTD